MEGLIVLIIMAVLSNLFSKNKKKSGAAPKTAGNSGLGKAVDRLEKWLDEQTEQSDEATAAPSVQQPTVRAVDRKAELMAKYGDRIKHGEGFGGASFEGVSRPLAPSAELAAGQAPGSLAYHSDEGEDLCDPTLLHGESGLETPAAPVFPAHTEDEPFLSAGDLVRGFVVSEILSRPTAGRMTRTR